MMLLLSLTNLPILFQFVLTFNYEAVISRMSGHYLACTSLKI